MASKKSPKEPKQEQAAVPEFDMDRLFATVQKEMGIVAANIQRGAFISNSISSGYLTLDLTLGGGWAGGRFIMLAGPEGGGKSTVSICGMREAIKMGAYTSHFDYEGGTDTHYAGKLGLRTDWKKEQDAKQPVLYRVFHLDTGEEAFNFMHRLLKTLPDAAPGSKIPVMFVLESLPSMLPKAIDENDEAGGMAIQARMFSAEIKKIKTLVTKKNAILMGINQLREKPGPSFGDPSYEPCGIAPRQFSDVRLRLSTRSAPKPWGGRVVTEECWDGNGVDTYRHTLVTTVKNKLAGISRDCWLRFTLTDRGHPGSGIDRVFDTYEYLRLTGQWEPVSKSSPNGIVTFPGLPYTGKTLKWREFKALIKDPANRKDPDTYLPTLCRKQMETIDASGKSEGFSKYFDTAGGIKAVGAAEDAEMEPDEEESEEE